MSATLLTNTVSFFVDEPDRLIAVAGFLVIIWQLLRTRKAAIAAKKAAQETQSSLQYNLMLVDISACIGMVEEIKTSIRNREHIGALLRITDLTSKLIQIRKLPDCSKLSEEDTQGVVSQVKVIRGILEVGGHDTENTLDDAKIKKIIKTLSKISDCLNEWIAVYKSQINKGN